MPAWTFPPQRELAVGDDMNAPPCKRMTLERFLAWEARQAERWEFDGLPTRRHGGRDGFACGDSARDVLALPEIGVELPLSKLYMGIEIDEPEADAG